MKIIFKIIKILFFTLLFLSCKNQPEDKIPLELIECPLEIRKSALEYAEKYKEAETEYEWGGQDPLRSIKVDCSGLVVRCYQYALKNNQLYKLPFEDATVKNMAEKYSFETKNPVPGDLVFMGEENSNEITHIGIYVKTDDLDNVYFIDSTQKDENNDGIFEINGVSERTYKTNNKKIKGYGIMACVYK